MKRPLTLEEINSKRLPKVILTAIGFNWRINHKGLKKRYVICECQCGGTIEVMVSSFVKSNYQSCGCRYKSRPQIKYTKNIPQLYKTWKGIKKRCYNANEKNFKSYGGDGVVVCEEWLSDYQKFMDWALANGWKPGLQVDKDILYAKKFGTKTGKIYSPEFCCIVTPKQNSNQRSDSLFYEYNGEEKTVSVICDMEGADKSVVYARLKRGYSLSDALKPKKTRKAPVKYLYKDETLTVGEIAKLENIPVGRIISLSRRKVVNITDIVLKIKNNL